MRKYIAFALLLMAGQAFATTNEIAVSTTIKVAKDALQVSRQTGTVQIQMSGTKFNSQTVTATTTNQFLAKGSVSSSGWYFMRNLSTNLTDKVFLSFDGGTTTSHVLEAKEPQLGRLHPSALVTNFVVSTTNGAVDFEFTLIED